MTETSDMAEKGPTQTAYLFCRTCQDDTRHDLSYVGRLLFSTRCSRCGLVLRHDQQDFAATYLRDLEHRVLTKPVRLVRRVRRQPVRFFRTLPAAVARQPRKFANELRVVWRDRHSQSPR